MQCGLSAWYARAECCGCLVSSIRLRRFCDTVRRRCWVRRPLPNDSKTLPLRTTGPAAARTSASDANVNDVATHATTPSAQLILIAINGLAPTVYPSAPPAGSTEVSAPQLLKYPGVGAHHPLPAPPPPPPL